MRILWERDEKSAHSAPKMSNQAALECVKNLIDVENDYLLSKASYRWVTLRDTYGNLQMRLIRRTKQPTFIHPISKFDSH